MSTQSIVVLLILIASHLILQPLVIAQETTSSSELSSQLSQDTKKVESPLLDNSVRGGYALLSSQAYKASYHPYPVLVETINDYPIKHLLHGYQSRLLPGKYVVELRPNFSVLTDIKPFMNGQYETKRIELTLEGNKEYAIGARINPDLPEQWQVQFFDIKAMATSESQP